MARLLADALCGLIVDIFVAAVDEERSGSGKIRSDIVEGNVLAIEVVVDIFTDLFHNGVIGRIIVKKGHVRETQVCYNHGVNVLLGIPGTKVVTPDAFGVRGSTTWQSSRQSILTKLAPSLKGELKVLRFIVYVIVRKQNSAGLEVRIR
jgi:hypothetical protein